MNEWQKPLNCSGISPFDSCMTRDDDGGGIKRHSDSHLASSSVPCLPSFITLLERDNPFFESRSIKTIKGARAGAPVVSISLYLALLVHIFTVFANTSYISFYLVCKPFHRVLQGLCPLRETLDDPLLFL